MVNLRRNKHAIVGAVLYCTVLYCSVLDERAGMRAIYGAAVPEHHLALALASPITRLPANLPGPPSAGPSPDGNPHHFQGTCILRNHHVRSL